MTTHNVQQPEELVRREPQRLVASETDTVRERRWELAPGQVVSLLAGIGFVTVGLIAVLRAGIDSSMDQPVVQVLGFSHTAWLGIAELALGLLLVLAGADVAAKGLSVFLGAIMVIGGILVAAAPEQMPEQLGLEKGYGTPLILVGAVVALAALLLPAWRSHQVDRTIVDAHA